jgi:hypothetical protein
MMNKGGIVPDSLDEEVKALASPLRLGETWHTKDIKAYQYEPQADITVYELALMMPLFLGSSIGPTITYLLQNHPELNRHFIQI